MSRMDVLQTIIGLLPDADPAALELELTLAGETINHLRGWEDDRDVEPRYRGLQVELAIAAYNKRGVEGQTSHTEIGVRRVYGNSDIYPKELLRRVTPRIRGVRSYENA